MIFIRVPGEAVAQGRPRFNSTGKFVRVFDPQKSRGYKNYVRSIADKMNLKPIEGAIVMTVIVYKAIPKSWSKKKQNEAIAGTLRPTSKPDLDNYVKAIKDALNGIAYRDDSQIVQLLVIKLFHTLPRVEITIEEAADDTKQSKTANV